jgi:hypothetical protein
VVIAVAVAVVIVECFCSSIHLLLAAVRIRRLNASLQRSIQFIFMCVVATTAVRFCGCYLLALMPCVSKSSQAPLDVTCVYAIWMYTRIALSTSQCGNNSKGNARMRQDRLRLVTTALRYDQHHFAICINSFSSRTSTCNTDATIMLIACHVLFS